MNTNVLEPRARFFKCPSCDITERSYLDKSPDHRCKELKGLTVPLERTEYPNNEATTRHKLIEREDYIGKSGGHRIMASQLERPDGSYDTNVYAPTARLDLRKDLGGPGAWSASAVFAYAVLQSLNKAFNWASDTIMVALYNNTPTPSQTVTTAALSSYNGAASQWVIANEVSQAVQWPAGGVALASIVVSQSTNVIKFTGANTASGAAATLANVYGCLVYDSSVSSEGLCFNSFGGSNSVTSGTFTCTWNASGIATFAT